MASRSGSPEAPAWPGPPMFRAPEAPMEDQLSPTGAGSSKGPLEEETAGSLWTPPSAHESPTASTPGPDDFAEPSHEDASEAQPGEKPSKAGPSRTSSAKELAGIQETAAGAVTFATSFAHEHLTRDEYERAVHLYLASDKDVDGVSRPAARLIGRHAAVDGMANPDVQDGIQLLFALAGYITVQWARLREAAALRKHVTTTQLDTGEGEALS